MTVEKIADHVMPMLLRGDCIAWVGSGFSAGLFPSWSSTLESLCSACGVGAPADCGGLTSNELMELADRCKRQDGIAYHATLCALFGEERIVPGYIDSRAQTLVTLPFCAIVTTNWDPLLDLAVERIHGGAAFTYSYPDLQSKYLERNQHSVGHLHGSARIIDRSSFVLSSTEYNTAYRSSALKSFLEQTLLSHDILFLGCGLDEPYMQPVFEQVQTIVESLEKAHGFWPAKQRCAVLSARNWRIRAVHGAPTASELELDSRDRRSEFLEAGRFKNLHIETVRYQATDSHAHLDAILDRLARLVPLAAPPPTSAIDPKGPSI